MGGERKWERQTDRQTDRQTNRDRDRDTGALIRGVPQNMCSTLHPVRAGKLFYVRLLAGKKPAELGLLWCRSAG